MDMKFKAFKQNSLEKMCIFELEIIFTNVSNKIETLQLTAARATYLKLLLINYLGLEFLHTHAPSRYHSLIHL